MSEFETHNTPENEDAKPLAGEVKENTGTNVEGTAENAGQAQSTIFVKHEYNTKKPARNGGRRRVLVCVLSVVLCIAIAASVVLVVNLIPNPNDAASSTPSSAGSLSFSILSADDIIKSSFVDVDGQSVEVESNISGVGMYNYYGEYSLLPYYEKAEPKDETDTSSDASSASSSGSEKTYLYDTKWYINGISPELTLTKTIARHIRTCLNVSATKKMENTFNSVGEYHAYYGIDDPTRVFSVEFNDGTKTLEIRVGKQIATGDGNYLTVSGDDTVYIVSSDYISNYDYLPVNFADKTMVEKIEKTDDNASYFGNNDKLARFDYIKLSGSAVGDREIVFNMSTGSSADYMPYMMTVPYRRPASESFIENILNFASAGLDADTLYSFNCTDENFKACGFDRPNCVIELKAGDYRFKLTVGSLMGDGSDALSVLVDGKKQIFSLSTKMLDFVTPDITKMFNQNFIMEDIYKLSDVTLADATGSYTFHLKHTPQSGNETAYDTVVTLNGSETDTKSFKMLYQRVLMLSLLSFTTEAEKTEPVLTVKMKAIADGSEKLIEFTESPNDIYHYIAWVDGVPLGEVLKSSVADVVTNLDIYVKGGEVPSAW